MNRKYYENDMQEIIEFIDAYPSKNEKLTLFSNSLQNITEDINESFLMDRAEFLKSMHEDNKFRDSLHKLDSLCSEKFCKECPVKLYCNHFIKRTRAEKNQGALNMVDLFCGAGGLSLGFTEEGFVTCLANDIEPCCIDTYAHNHPETPRDHIVLGDINDVVNNLDVYLQGKVVDIVVGGPPCQGFSMANRQRLIDDPRNYLYKKFVEVVEKAKPKFFVMENVKGMLGVASQVIEDFNSIGYCVSAKVLNAKDFGVPQNRERLIYIGNCIGVDNDAIFAKLEKVAENLPDTVLGDAIYGLRELKASRIKNSTDINDDISGRRIGCSTGITNEYIEYINQGRKLKVTCNHKARYNNDRDIEIFGRMDPGDRSDDPKIADIMPYASRNDIFKDKYFKLDLNKICKTITAHMKFDCNMYIHPTQARGLTPREAARVQSYPDDYFFRGAYTKTYMQIGNSVPPILGRAIAKVVKEYLRKDDINEI